MARQLAQVFHHSKLLPTKQVVELHAAKLLNKGERLDMEQTLEQHLGKTFVVSDADLLIYAPNGRAMLTSLAAALPKLRFAGQLVTILSGRQDGMTKVMEQFPGLSRCLKKRFAFNSLTPAECSDLLCLHAKSQGVDITCLRGGHTTPKILDRLRDLKGPMTRTNGHNVKMLVQSMISTVFDAQESLASAIVIGEKEVLEAIEVFQDERRRSRTASVHSPTSPRSPTAAKSPTTAEPSEQSKQRQGSWVNVEIRVEDMHEDLAATSPTDEQNTNGKSKAASKDFSDPALSKRPLLVTHAEVTSQESLSAGAPSREQTASPSSSQQSLRTALSSRDKTASPSSSQRSMPAAFASRERTVSETSSEADVSLHPEDDEGLDSPMTPAEGSAPFAVRAEKGPRVDVEEVDALVDSLEGMQLA